MSESPPLAGWRYASRPPPNESVVAAFEPRLGLERCTIVTGSAGGGKTTLLGQWFTELEAAQERPIWLSVAAGASGHIPRSTIESSVSGRTLFIDVAGNLDSLEIESYLITMATEPDDTPARLVVATRTLPTRLLDWSRHGDIRVIDLDELSPTAELIPAILLTYRPDLEQDDLARLCAKVGNWPAGAHLAGRAIGGHATPTDAVDRFDGQDLGVSDYLDTEVFAGLDSLDQEFLVTCSVLSELTGDACAVLTGDSLAHERLRRLGGQHALISASTSGVIWSWRPLAQTYLLGKLALRSSDEVVELRRRARGWAAARRMYSEAIHQARETGDYSTVVRLILETGLDTVAAGGGARVLAWIDELPAMIRRTEAGLAVVAAVAEWATGGYDARETVADWLAYADSIGGHRPPASAPSTATASQLLWSLLCAEGPDGDQGIEEPTSSSIGATAWDALELAIEGLGAYLDDNLRRGRHHLAMSLRLARPARQEPDWFTGLIRPSVVGALALIEQEDGNHDQAGVLLSAATEPRLPGGRQAEIDTGILPLAQARQSRYERHDAAALNGLSTVATTANLPWVRVLARIELANLYGQLGDRDRHEINLRETDQLMDELASPSRLLVRLRLAVDRHTQGILDGDAGLTERELEVLRLLDTDLTRRQIAAQLFLAHNTVKTYIQRLYQKLGVSSRPAAVAQARQRGWLA